jgi:hypothetical protein
MVIILNFEGVVEGGNSHTIKNFVSKLIDRVEGKEPGANAAGGYIVKMIGKYKGKFKVGGRKITLHQDVRDAIQFLANVVDMAPVNAKLVDVKVDELRREVTEEVARVEGTMNEKVGELREDVYEELGVLREVVAKQFTTMNVLMRANWPEWRAEGPAKALANFPAAAKGAPTSVLCLTAAAHCDSPPSEKEPLAGEPKPQQVSLPERVAPEITELAAGAAEVDSTADQSSQESSEGAATEQQAVGAPLKDKSAAEGKLRAEAELKEGGAATKEMSVSSVVLNSSDAVLTFLLTDTCLRSLLCSGRKY